ncbi:hypothetical protein ACFPVX_00405 [Cohnella faecalis]|uniref:Zinc ribbon domain-containing protein n=1 Tax=Cohnella faecalis TaxID=2315694 RepID=A0A398CLX4_9BACL|nr:hypothetical protein [Cohnella faecalis]RIE02219.1 hypothetical protein D3H35_15895 [Cohnella faecalis]
MQLPFEGTGFRLVSAVSVWGYSIAIGSILLLLGGMIAVIRASSDDSGKFSELRQMVEAMFGTPAHLRPGSDDETESSRQTAAGKSYEPFEDRCPACQITVTHEHQNCPSCGLRLLD